MDNILLRTQNENCLVYMDDIIVFCPTIYEHKACFKQLKNTTW